MKYLYMILVVTFCVYFIPSRHSPQNCCPETQPALGMAWASEIPCVQTNIHAHTLKTGSVKGNITFERRRPRQPVVVYLKRIDGELKYKVPAEEVVKQKNARFDPSFLTVVRGQKVVFDNNETEEINHNVYFLGEEKKDLGVFGHNSKRGHVFGKAGEVEVYCSIHSMMDAKIFVAPNPHFVVLSKDDSTFALEDVPEGRYSLMTYQKAKRFKDVAETITIVAGKELEKNLVLKR